MFTHVCKIIWAQRKTNGWIFAELLLAMCAIWFLMDKVWVDQRCYHAPMGFDIQNCWRFRLGQLPEEVEAAMDSDGTDNPTTVMLTLMERIRQEPEVEEVCIAYFSMPYSQGDTWTTLFPVEGDTTGLTGES
ncbi:MAG: multidrug ABC transporter substrate-binding protein, partial [Parabacteroides sp.]